MLLMFQDTIMQMASVSVSEVVKRYQSRGGYQRLHLHNTSKALPREHLA